MSNLKADLLCIADSNWVLGHWYTNCMLNGRELTDFTSMAGIAEDKLGHVRALFRFMEEHFDLPEYQLEFGRDAEQIHSMELLDAPPQNWADFILTLFLADVAIWQFTNGLREAGSTPITNLLTKFGEEVYFHQLCIDGWLKALDESEQVDLESALRRRLAIALAWFDDEDAQANYLKAIEKKLAISLDTAVADKGQWDALRRRTNGSQMPPRLWESIVPTSDEALLARRPLAVSVDDNIDLFSKTKKDETEPQFG
ncbi:MAG: Phenylacetic acid catabolic protein [Woeseiaceae bacterium]